MGCGGGGDNSKGTIPNPLVKELLSRPSLKIVKKVEPDEKMISQESLTQLKDLSDAERLNKKKKMD